jgi:hypothetical protein
LFVCHQDPRDINTAARLSRIQQARLGCKSSKLHSQFCCPGDHVDMRTGGGKRQLESETITPASCGLPPAGSNRWQSRGARSRGCLQGCRRVALSLPHLCRVPCSFAPGLTERGNPGHVCGVDNMYMAGDRTGPGPDVTTKQAMVAQSQLYQLLAKNWFPNGVGWKRRANNERTSLVRSLCVQQPRQTRPPPFLRLVSCILPSV